jgi:pimeloyl-ACP methyl ester carboxylesterase
VLPALKDRYPDEAVMVFAGGPGQSAMDNAVLFDYLLNEVRQQRSIIMVDQRGTGASFSLTCDETPLDIVLVTQASDTDIMHESTVCKKALNVDLNLFHSRAALQDYEAIRKQLNISKLHLVGISYGTRMVQLYMDTYPQVVATASMDGVLPLGHNLLDIGQSSARALTLLFKQCLSQQVCKRQFGDLIAPTTACWKSSSYLLF